MPDTKSSPPSPDRIVQHWAAPPQWGYVKENPSELFVIDGEARGGIEEGLTEDTVNRIRAGYMCVICKEPHEKPWPKLCSLCGFAMRLNQERVFKTLFRGEARLGHDYGPTVNIEQEIDRLDDELERDNWAEHPTLGIVVPRSAA